MSARYANASKNLIIEELVLAVLTDNVVVVAVLVAVFPLDNGAKNCNAVCYFSSEKDKNAKFFKSCC